MFKTLLSVLAISLVCSSFAETTSSLTENAQGDQITKPQRDLKTQYVDKLGNEWSEVLPNQYTNGCESWGDGSSISCANKTAIDNTSAAFVACSKRGWRLPSRQDWDRLTKEFDSKEHRYGLSLTKKGQTEFKKKFNTKNGDMYASATVSGGDRDSFSFAFSTYWTADVIQKSIDNDSLDATKETFSAHGREKAQSVICVRESVATS